MIDPARSHLPLNPTIEPSARPLLTKQLLPLLVGYLRVLERHAQEHSIPISGVEISGFEDPEDGSRQLVITEQVDLPADEVMTYWRRVGDAVESWVKGLSKNEADRVAEWIAMEISPNADDAAA